MKATWKFYLLVLMLVLTCLPFVVLTDLFPFPRYAMFAEPVKNRVQEKFILLSDLEGSVKEIDENQVGWMKSQLNYLARYAFYQNKTEELMRCVHEQFSAMGKNGTLYLYRIKIYPDKVDSLLIAQDEVF